MKIIEITMPDSEEGTTSAIERWLKQVGDQVTQDEPLIEIATDKVTVEIASPSTGILVEIIRQNGEQVIAGELLGKIEKKDTALQQPDLSPASSLAEERDTMTANTSARKLLSPAVRRMIREYGVDIDKIVGSGRNQRITSRDVADYLRKHPTQRVYLQDHSKDFAKESTAETAAASSRMVRHNHMRRSIAAHMVESMLKTAPHVTSVFELDMTALICHRNKYKPILQNSAVNLTFTAYFIAAAVAALQEVPEVNSRWHEDALEIFSDCNIGVATAVDNGLVVPVIHRAQALSLQGIATQLQQLTTAARSNTLQPQDVQGGTFTITNHGVSGSLLATPIINQPQSAILGIGKMQKRVVVVEQNGRDCMQICPMAYVTLTIDHRVLDGYQANLFLQKFVSVLERWE